MGILLSFSPEALNSVIVPNFLASLFPISTTCHLDSEHSFSRHSRPCGPIVQFSYNSLLPHSVRLKVVSCIRMMASEKAQDAIGPAAEYDPRRDSTASAAKVVHNARAATEKEQRMSLWEGIKTYPKAVGWSLLISTCIAMEGYDICLVNNFYAFPQFNRKYGELTSRVTIKCRLG